MEENMRTYTYSDFEVQRRIVDWCWKRFVKKSNSSKRFEKRLQRNKSAINIQRSIGLKVLADEAELLWRGNVEFLEKMVQQRYPKQSE